MSTLYFLTSVFADQAEVKFCFSFYKRSGKRINIGRRHFSRIWKITLGSVSPILMKSRLFQCLPVANNRTWVPWPQDKL